MSLNAPQTTGPKFTLGQIVGTPAALKAIREAGQTAVQFLRRHVTGDWGEVCADDAKLNDESLKGGSHVLSAYTLRSGVRIWIITEAVGQRSTTTILLSQEY